MLRGNLILFIICLITIIAGAIIYIEASAFQKKAKITEGVVESISLSYYNVKYISEDGGVYIHKSRQNSKGKYHDGDKFKVFYQTDNPDISRLSDGKKSGKNIVLVGIGLLLFNFYSVYSGKKLKKREETFKTTGRKVEAEITKIDVDMSITIKRRNPYFVDCKWTDPITGKEYTHKIRYIWEDPNTLLAGRRKIDVYIDRENPDNYFMDIALFGVVAR